MRVFVYSTSPVPSDFAHTIQILKTARALAEQPGVKATVYFLTLAAELEAIWRRLGLEPPANVEIKGMAPEWVFRILGKKPRIGGEVRGIHRWMRWRLGRELKRSALREPTVAYTRSENVVALLGDAASKAGAPLFLELHTLKYVDRFWEFLEKRRQRGLGAPSLSECKRFLEKQKGIEEKRLRGVKGIFCVSEGIRRVLEKWDLGVPLATIPNGVDLGAFEPGPAEGTPIDILYSGQLYPWKGVDGLVKAMRLLPNHRLTIVGGNQPEDLARIRSLAEQSALGERIEFAGQQPHGAIPGFIRRAKVCVAPLPGRGFTESRYFTCPLKLFEYAACGKAIVASDLPSLREDLVHGQNAWLVRPDDPAALAAGLRTVLEDEDLRRRLGEGALRLAREHDYRNRAKRILQFFGAAAGTMHSNSKH